MDYKGACALMYIVVIRLRPGTILSFQRKELHMAIQLFTHNLDAYCAAASMLAETGKAGAAVSTYQV